MPTVRSHGFRLRFERSRRWALVTMAVGLASSWSLAQVRLVETWNAERGLPNNTVTALARSRDGFLWVGTDNGLARFDGFKFRNYAPQSSPTLGSGRVRSLCAWGGDGVWFSTTEPGMVQLRSVWSGLTSARFPGGPQPVVSMIEGPGENLFCADADGVVRHFDNGSWTVMHTNIMLPDKRLRLFADRSGEVLFAGGHQLGRLGMSTNRILAETGVAGWSFALPSSKGWWLGVEGILTRWNGGGAAQRFAFPTNVIEAATAAVEDRAGNLWIGTEQLGLWCRTTEGGVLAFTSTNGLGSDTVLCLLDDADDSIWVGTEGGGLSRVRPRTFQVPVAAGGFAGENISVIREGASGEFWAGVERRGLFRFEESSTSAVSFAVEQSVQSEPVKRIRSLEFDSAQRLWVGSQDAGLFFVEGDALRSFATSPRLRQVSALFEDEHWRLWVGAETSNSLMRIVGEAPQFFPVANQSPSLDVRVFVNDGSGGLWFGTQGNGLFHWDGRTSRQFGRSDGLGSETIWSLLLDADDGALWIGTAGGGLSRFKNGRIQTCANSDGLYNDVICQILDDGTGWLWCGSQAGVFRVWKSGLRDFFEHKISRIHSVAYGLGDGLPALECSGGSQPAGWRSRDGRLWWPTARGLAWVEPKLVRTNRQPPTVLLDQVVVNETPVETSALGNVSSPLVRVNAGEMIIKPGSHRIEFRYAALSWPASEFVRFQHRLVGFDAGWIEAGAERSVHYNGLPPKAYRFEVMAVNRDGVASVAPAVVAFRIQPFFWQTWWFRLTAGLALAGSAGLFVGGALRRRHRARLERLERLHAVEQERTRIAQDIHDDLGAQLTEIALLSELAQSQIEEPQAARGHLDSIFNNARKLARATDEIVWALHPKNNSVEMSLAFITRSAQEFLRAAGVRCRLDFPAELPAATMPSVTRHHLYLAVKEALNNVVKHGAATEVWMRLKCQPDRLTLSIEDNGRGFDPAEVRATASSRSASGRGHGLRGMQQRMQAVGGSFQQSSTPGRGTITRFAVPLGA